MALYGTLPAVHSFSCPDFPLMGQSWQYGFCHRTDWGIPHWKQMDHTKLKNIPGDDSRYPGGVFKITGEDMICRGIDP